MENTNSNHIATDHFSNPASEAMYFSQWQDEPEIAENFYFNGKQCGGCSFFAKFNSDWGLCCHPNSRHHLETVFEHFTCPSFVDEGWDAHRFVTAELREHLENYEKQNVAICRLVSAYVITNDLGIVTGRDSDYQLDEGFLPYKLDLGFIAKDRPIKKLGTSYLTAPDLAIKIVTTFDTAQTLNDEVMMFLQSQTRQVWVVYPFYYPMTTMSVYTLTPDLNFTARILTKGDILDGGDVLPGFRIPFNDIFSYTRR